MLRNFQESLKLDRNPQSHDNLSMEIHGHVQNGVVVFDEGAVFPEGARVVVALASPVVQEPQPAKKPVELPLVSSGEPGTVHLTNERIHEILDDEDIEAMKRTWNVPS